MDASEFKDVFAAEAHEYLQALNQYLLRLENNPDDRTALNEMFRAAHSLKGMSGTMGYQELADFTHQIESVLDLLRIGELSATEPVVNVLFSAIDGLQTLLEKTLLEEELPDLRHLAAELRKLMQKRDNLEISLKHQEDSQKLAESSIDITFEDFELEVVQSAANEGYLPYKIVIRLRPKTLLKSVRVYTVFQALEQVGTIIKSNPPAQDLEDEKFDLEFAVILLSQKDRETIANTVERISEIEYVSVTPIEFVPSKPAAQAVSPQENQPSSELAAAVEKTSPAQQHAKSAPVMSRGAFVDRYIRVETERLDGLINLIGELVISKTQVMEIQTEMLTDNTKNALVQLDRITTELQYAAMKLRMVPIKQVFDRFPRLVRDFAQTYGKEINLEIVGEETELDRSLVNQIGDPLVHLVRNSIDHGIETTEQRLALGKSAEATLRLSAFHEGGHVIIQVYDDGQGLELERIKESAIEKGLLPPNYSGDLTMEQAVDLIFRPGFSTNKAVTDVSGRGVGMDVVKSIVEGLSGQVEIESSPGEGICVTIKLPLTLAIIKALLVTCGSQVYALPIQSVRENLLVISSQIKTVSRQKVIVLRDEILPLLDLNEALGFGQVNHGDTLSVIVVESQGEKAGFIVDDIIGQQEIVIKSLPNILGDIRGISGATVLGNGDVALILDHNSLIKGRSESIG
ncbi:MAG TPA: chemotaxis protein CheA [Firmicutes bacterium]|nr:chemotaxis protein CheA [Bacillota bacterium]